MHKLVRWEDDKAIAHDPLRIQPNLTKSNSNSKTVALKLENYTGFDQIFCGLCATGT
jgi:hypothetical protein